MFICNDGSEDALCLLFERTETILSIHLFTVA